jgi:hypothetical protein
MKLTTSLLSVLLFPVATIAGTDLVLDDNYEQVEFSCTVESTEPGCSDPDDPDDAAIKLIHTATISVSADPGHTCVADIEIINVHDFGFNSPSLLKVFATEHSPGSSSVTYSRPILIEARDSFRLVVGNVSGASGGCRGSANVGVELKKN